jgi:ABC-type spermidine/putrescine transport system permease subunit I
VTAAPTGATATSPAAAPLRSSVTGSGARWLALPPLALLGVGMLLPTLAVVWIAVTGDDGIGGLFTPLSSGTFRSAVGRTLWLSALCTVLTLGVGVVYALAIALAPRWLSRVLIAVLFLTFWISLLVRTYGWVLTLQPAGALDSLTAELGLAEGLDLFQTMPGLLLAMVHIMLPYVVLPVSASLSSIDPTTIRAARSLGAGDGLVLRRIVLPALVSGGVAGAVIVFVLCLGFYVTPAFLGAPQDQLVSTVIGTQFGRLQDLSGAAAMGVLLLLVVLALYALADRFFRISEKWGGV